MTTRHHTAARHALHRSGPLARMLGVIVFDRDDRTGGIPAQPPRTIDDMRDERARHLNTLDDIARTCTEQNRTALTDDERAAFDAATTAIDSLDDAIRAATLAAGDADRLGSVDAIRSRYLTVQVNTGGSGSSTRGRSLDELLHASDEVVRAGSFDRTGQFRPNQYGAVNPVDQVIVRSAQLGTDIEAPRITSFRPEDREAIRTFQRTVADMILFGLLIDKSAKSSVDGFEVARAHRAFRTRWSDVLRAMDTDTSAEGTEWVPTGIGASIHEKVRAMGRVAPLFARINLPTNPWKWPLEGADVTAYRVAEPTSDTATKVSASTPGTGAATFDAEIFGARALFSRSLDADSALAILPFATRKLVIAFASAEEKAILDGDSDGTHQDTDVQALGATDARTAWDGLRKRALANCNQATTSTSVANLHAIRAAMGKWGLDPASLAFIVGVSAAMDLIADSNVMTVDKMGPNATILNGQVASVYGIPVVVSEHVREDLNASGVQDGITTTKTYNLCVNRDEWVMGQRMALDVEADDSIYRETYQRVVVGFMREDFQNIGDSSSNDDTSIGYNVTP